MNEKTTELIIRDFQKDDQQAVEAILVSYWNDQEFLKKLSERLQMAVDTPSPEYTNQTWRFL